MLRERLNNLASLRFMLLYQLAQISNGSDVEISLRERDLNPFIFEDLEDGVVNLMSHRDEIVNMRNEDTDFEVERAIAELFEDDGWFRIFQYGVVVIGNLVQQPLNLVDI